jgi:hypothetical protein
MSQKHWQKNGKKENVLMTEKDVWWEKHRNEKKERVNTITTLYLVSYSMWTGKGQFLSQNATSKEGTTSNTTNWWKKFKK